MATQENATPKQTTQKQTTQKKKNRKFKPKAAGNSSAAPKEKSQPQPQRQPQRQQQPQPQPSAGRPGQPKPASDKVLRVIPLGGLDGIGKNMTAFEYGDDMLLVDAGLMFPDDDHPGIDLILPDYSYVLENAHKLRAIVVTHGHEDHTGALPYLLKDLAPKQVPIIATKLTLGLIRGKLEEHRVKNVRWHEVSGGVHLKRGVFGLDFIHMNHSIPDSLAVVIHTPVGNVLHTGDFKLDQTPIDGRVADYGELARFGEAGIMLLLSDSTNAEHSGMTRSEAEVGRTLKTIISAAKNRVIVASFSSHIHRVQQVCDAAREAGRKIVVTGRSMLQNTRIARELGYLAVPDEDFIDAYDMKNLPENEVVVLCTGSQGEPLSALARMAGGEHRTVHIAAGDTVILSATPVPGNEKAVGNIVNRLMKIGADVYEKNRAEVHVSGHASSEELKLLLNLVKPEYFMPVHGEMRHLVAHKNLALSVGIPEENIFVLDNGDVLEFDDNDARIAEPVQNGVIYVDGLNVGDADSVVLRDRQHLSQDGIVTVVMTVSRKRGKQIGSPEVIIRGISVPDSAQFQRDIAARASKTLERSLREHAALGDMRRSVRDSVSQLVWEQTKTRPMTIPTIIEI
ncbi:MAG: ribonuclease J [Actinomycetes bacterium]|jgi:ribonuclease J|nr:ribonuclease J [Actinomycetes bacterium]